MSRPQTLKLAKPLVGFQPSPLPTGVGVNPQQNEVIVRDVIKIIQPINTIVRVNGVQTIGSTQGRNPSKLVDIYYSNHPSTPIPTPRAVKTFLVSIPLATSNNPGPHTVRARIPVNSNPVGLNQPVNIPVSMLSTIDGNTLPYELKINDVVVVKSSVEVMCDNRRYMIPGRSVLTIIHIKRHSHGGPPDPSNPQKFALSLGPWVIEDVPNEWVAREWITEDHFQS